jgi:osmotically-inducible protein OsmY
MMTSRARSRPNPALTLASFALGATRPLCVLIALAACALSLTACGPALVVAGAGATAMVATDRRTTGAQVDDESIELKINTSINSSWGMEVHQNVTSYNGMVLLTGEVPSTEIKNEITRIAKTTTKVQSVTNEMVVGPVADIGARSNDTYLTSAVKTRFIDADKFAPNHVKVVTERGVVYLMGIVSREEGDAAGQIAATTSGVQRVVKLFQYTN